MSSGNARTEFELWYSNGGEHPEAVRRNGESYRLMGAHEAWQAWEAAWIAALTAPVAVTDEQVENYTRQLSRLCALPISQKHMRTILEQYDAAPKASAPEGRQPRTDAEIVSQTNDLARIMLRYIGTGYEVPPDHRFYEAQDARSRKAWAGACEIMEHMTQTDPNDALSGIDDENESVAAAPTPFGPIEDAYLSPEMLARKYAAAAPKASAPEDALPISGHSATFLADLEGWNRAIEEAAHEASSVPAIARAILAKLAAAPTPPAVTEPSIARGTKWCQPGDMQANRYFIVRFDDADRGDAIFTDEAEAREFWARATMSWNCWLFGAMPVAPTPPAATEAEPAAWQWRFTAFVGSWSDWRQGRAPSLGENYIIEERALYTAMPAAVPTPPAVTEAVLAEREECAKIADDPWSYAPHEFATSGQLTKGVAAAIRARSAIAPEEE
ncbi:hypothetical protein [Microvirga antarctica]|uniref:hypothetical protein n=1 Tax=Microvirga antarctica TaxID=2819233 RepID=UPI001B30CD89|nr:hypothetical protein [Microvirga antarctica]